MTTKQDKAYRWIGSIGLVALLASSFGVWERIRMKSLTTATLAMLFLVLCAGAWATEPTHDQKTCPVMIGNDIDKSLYVTHKGKRIYFCCKMCINMFKEAPEKYLGNLPATRSEKFPVKDTETNGRAAVASDYTSSSGHDHGHDHGTNSAATTFIGKFHPVVVHFPIALIIIAAFAELLFVLRSDRTLFRQAARFNIHLATISGAMAVLLGFAAASGSSFPPEYANILMIHKSLGIVTLIMAAASSLILEIAIRKASSPLIWTYRILLIACALSVATAGHFGGLLVYGLNHFKL